MTAPKRDGRPMLERARECAKLWGYEAHDRSGEVAEALRAVMPVVEAAIAALRDASKRAKLDDAVEEIRRPCETYTSGKPIRRRALPHMSRAADGVRLTFTVGLDTGEPPVDYNALRRCGATHPSGARCILAPGHESDMHVSHGLKWITR